MGGRLTKSKVFKIAVLLLLLAAISPVLYYSARVFLCDRFVSKGVSMLPTIETGKGVYVNKLILGGRIYTDFDFDSPDLHCFRMPGPRNLRVGDVAVFNYPYGWGGKKIGFKINFVYMKRCVGIPGDTVSIVQSRYVNSRTDVTGIPDLNQQLLQRTPDDVLLKEKALKAGQFAGKGEEWTIKNFGPVTVPGKGMKMHIDSTAAMIYSRVIEYETGKAPAIGGEYVFKGNWYFFAGDNVSNSKDSRYFGFVPEDFVIGVVPKYSICHNL